MDHDSLFALKLYYEDEYEDEYEIIKMLKIELINQGISESNANVMLKNFYDSFNSNIDINIFESIRINDNVFMNHISSLINNYQNNLIEPIMNQILNININNEIINPEDVISVLNDEDKNKLKKYTLENKLEDKCSICIDSMEEKQEVVELPCLHTYHSDCIMVYLSNYNYKCPYCKMELGSPTYRI
jgi:hypothetical protein